MPSFLLSQLTRSCWFFNLSIVIFLGLFLHSAHAAEICHINVAQVASVQGTVERNRLPDLKWRPIEKDNWICAGDRVRVRNKSNAALRLHNNSLLRLDQKTTIVFPADEANKKRSFMDLIKGAIHIFTRTPQPFDVKTPFMNAGVEGTEFFVGVDELSAQLVVFEGRVKATNDFGSLILVAHEAALAQKEQPPQQQIVINPIDSVQWALYYPTIIEYWAYDDAGTQSIRSQIAVAANFLALGSITEAEEKITRILKLDPDNNDAHALQAIIALTQNNTILARETAQRAIDLSPNSTAALLALSYVQQAYFEIDEALESVQQAITQDPHNALIWARLAELQMSTGELEQALESAREAVTLNPSLAKTQTVLGFAHLMRMNTAKAQTILGKAILLDQTDPMPRLGLGLALIREGQLEAGRIEMETAVSLDPGDALIRSYLGKAYFEEKRYPLAETQLDMAKERDPLDPTPWLYGAIQKQTQNRPIEALHDIQKSIELNDNRAVYRSRLLLDQDEAGRGSSLSRIFDNLGFEKRAIMQTAQSLSIDPSSHSAHRFLSDIYVNIPRHEIARVSELLQAQLLQPINLNPVQPQLAVADLNIITNTGPTAVGFNEFTPLMERSRPQLVASTIAGSNNTFGDEIVYSQIKDKTSVSVGQFHYQSNGFRPNNDQNHNIQNAFLQHALTPRLNIQAEIRNRETRHGDLLLDFNTDEFNDKYRRKIHEKVARFGAKYALTPDQDLIFSGKYIDRFERTNSQTIKNEGFQIEAQHLLRHEFFNSILGGSFYRFNWINITDSQRIKLPFTYMDRKNGYFYTNINYLKDISLTLGLSYDRFNSTVSGKTHDKINPKFGIQWNILDNLRLRGAWFETTKSHLIAQQTLEPTQIAGFNQFFDDFNETRAKRMALGLDYNLTSTLFSGLEASKRILYVPFFPDNQEHLQKQRENLYRSYLYWLPHKHWALKGEFQFEQFNRNPGDIALKFNTDPVRIHTLISPVSVEYFHPSGFFSGITGTFVKQNLTRLGDTKNNSAGSSNTKNSGIDTFFLLDAFLGLRLPKRMGILSLEVRNLLDQQFFYRNINFQRSEAISPRFIPERTFFGRVTLNF